MILFQGCNSVQLAFNFENSGPRRLAATYVTSIAGDIVCVCEPTLCAVPCRRCINLYRVCSAVSGRHPLDTAYCWPLCSVEAWLWLFESRSDPIGSGFCILRLGARGASRWQSSSALCYVRPKSKERIYNTPPPGGLGETLSV